MGRKKKKNNLKNLLLTLLILIILIVLNHFGMIEKIDDLLAQTGLVEHFEEIKKSNTVTTGTVKNNTKIISSVSESIASQQDKLNVIFFKEIDSYLGYNHNFTKYSGKSFSLILVL